MAGNSALSWAEVGTLVSQSQAIWKNGPISGNSCLTRGDFLDQIVNDGALTRSSQLITLDEFNARKVVTARLTFSLDSGTGTFQMTQYAGLDATGTALASDNYVSGTVLYLDSRTRSVSTRLKRSSTDYSDATSYNVQIGGRYMVQMQSTDPEPQYLVI